MRVLARDALVAAVARCAARRARVDAGRAALRCPLRRALAPSSVSSSFARTKGRRRRSRSAAAPDSRYCLCPCSQASCHASMRARGPPCPRSSTRRRPTSLASTSPQRSSCSLSFTRTVGPRYGDSTSKRVENAKENACYLIDSPLLQLLPSLPPRPRSDGQERLGGDAALRLERLELGERLVRVPRVLRQAQVRERVREARHGLQLQHERLLLVRLRAREGECQRQRGSEREE